MPTAKRRGFANTVQAVQKHLCYVVLLQSGSTEALNARCSFGLFQQNPIACPFSASYPEVEYPRYS